LADISNMVFLGVVVADALLALHRRAHAALDAFRESCWEHYGDDQQLSLRLSGG
jgi:hypothetical protein